jgi:outer membrane protein assembly factor BamB
MSNALSLSRREVLTQLGTLTGIGVLLSVVSGCGGGQDTAASNGTGRVQLTISWPDIPPASRYIPAYAKSLVLELYPSPHYTLVANRPDTLPATQTISFEQLVTVGTYRLAGFARVERDGQGATVASAFTQVEVQFGLTVNADLTLNSTISTIEVLGQPLSLHVGESLTLAGHALDPDGKVVFLLGSALTWSQVSGAEFGEVTREGRFTAKAIGTARVRLTESGINVSTEANIQIVTRSQEGGLANSAWPKFRGDAKNTGRGGGSGATGQKKWEFLTGAEISSSPVIGSDGVVCVGSNDGRLYAIDESTSQKKWEFLTGAKISSSPVIGSDGVVYVSSDDGKLYAIDGSTGQKKWEFFKGELLTGDGISPSPIIGADGVVYFGNNYGNLYAIDGSTGQVKWKVPKGGGSSSPAIGSDRVVYVGSNNGNLYAIDGSTGQIKWGFSTRADISSSPAIGVDGTIYFSSRIGRVYAIDGSTGQKRWEFLIGNFVESSPAIGSDGVVYIGSSDSKLYAIDGSTGQKRWEFLTGGDIRSSPAIGADGTIYVGSADKKLYAIQ